jgi:Leucine Rich repeat
LDSRASFLWRTRFATTRLSGTSFCGATGVDASVEGSSEAQAEAGIAALVSAIGANTTLETVVVGIPMVLNSRHMETLGAALADKEGRLRGRQAFLSEQRGEAAPVAELPTPVPTPALAHSEVSAQWRPELERVVRGQNSDLELLSMSLGDSEVVEVVQTLSANPNAVKTLNLGGNAIGNAGAAAIANLLRHGSGCALEELYLFRNHIDAVGITALGDALRNNTSLRLLFLRGNPGIEGDGGLETAAAVESLVSAIRINSTLETIRVDMSSSAPHQQAVEAALADRDGRRRRRELYLSERAAVEAAAAAHESVQPTSEEESDSAAVSTATTPVEA